MPPKKAPPPLTPPPKTGYSATAKVALQETTARVQEMHDAIAATSFGVLNRIPVIGGTAQLIQQAHDAIAGGVYSAIHKAGGGLLDVADSLEKQGGAIDQGSQPPGRLASNLRSAINGAFGDHLAESNSVLAIPMGLYRHDQLLPLSHEALSAAWPENKQRLCIFIHGLVCNEHCWEAGPETIEMPRQIEVDTGYTALTLRYNSGLPIVENGLQLALWLEELLVAWPYPLQELIIIGHSMGGLLARSAFEQSKTADFNWPALTRMVICLGSPNLGSPVERLGQLTTQALRMTRITEPLAKIAAQRSQGIQDLRHGPGRHLSATPDIAWRFIGGSLTEDPENPLGKILGDGLVTPGSATAHELEGNVQSIRLGAVNHMGLLNDPRVYAQILAWLNNKE
ncbi:MAG: alpha/beta hydrolase [Betaproteobacteria bacterium]|nr:alpha/beta hydrolase [Betaproteobacteria bacterium]